ncbi:MAG: diaminopimelate epimerase [Bacteroidia bacterium]|nr:diaminopimelate epimerase [Bacteroidia bacterium]MCZ2277421.1 diaminopimelate epimerase [Bacteroidia bacterium]
MNLAFSKYHGAGNDFIIIDNRSFSFDKTNAELIARMCHRRFGIGADGLLLLEPDDELDFRMIYFNADGHIGSMCGNGGRCMVAYVRRLRMIENKTQFKASDGRHEAEVLSSDLREQKMVIKLKMQDVTELVPAGDDLILDTGSPHYVCKVSTLDQLDVVRQGRKIRYSPQFAQAGINVNFLEISNRKLSLRTYERGVEDETWSCGTGAVAAALAAVHKNWIKQESPVVIDAKGGTLSVHFKSLEGGYQDVWLEGNAIRAYDGQYYI